MRTISMFYDLTIPSIKFKFIIIFLNKILGLDWSSGNLRLVNVQGNSIFGSDLVVHDRSVEIPLKQWLYILNSILKSRTNYT